MASIDIAEAAAHTLYHAHHSGEPIAPLSETFEGLSIDDAYEISLRLYAMRKAAGEKDCLLYTSPSPRDKRQSRMPSSA